MVGSNQAMSSGSSGKVDRRHARYDVDWRVTLACKDWNMASKVAAANASRGGVFLVTQRPPPKGSAVELTISLPDGTRLRVSGTVVHVITPEQALVQGRGPGIGVRIDPRFEGDLVLLESMAQAQTADLRHEGPAPRRIVDVVGVTGKAVSAVGAAPAAAPAPPAPPVGVEAPIDLELDLEPLRPAPAPVPAPAPAPRSAPPAMEVPELGDLADELEPEPPPDPARPPRAITSPPGGGTGVLGRLRATRWVVPRGQACPVIGIDFGTTYTSVSVVVDDLAYLVPDGEGRVLHPSVVSYPEKSARLVGWAARERLAHDPRHTVVSAKRLLGQRFSDDSLTGYLQSLPYRTSAGPGDAILVHIDGEAYAMPQICSAVVAHARDLAEQALGTTIRQASFSCPVSYTEEQKAALRRAAQLAGLEVVAMVMEPVAGALAYGIGQERNEIVAVYDFGGGTFDFSLLDIAGDHVRVIASDGDAWLGGDDFDMTLAAAVADAFWRATKVELRQRVVEWQRLLMACEQAKRELSLETSAMLEIEHLIEAPKRIDLRQRIERGVFERLVLPLYDRSIEVCAQVLARAGLEPGDVTQVVVTGGVSRIPLVRDGLAGYFGREPVPTVNPEEAIALGAGLKGAQVSGHRVQGVARRA
jgi:actin-like ATPase involved in cell morphogenesis/Tfp pilus assembly protein PilZ